MTMTDADRGRAVMLAKRRAKDMRARGLPEASIVAMERQLMKAAETDARYRADRLQKSVAARNPNQNRTPNH